MEGKFTDGKTYVSITVVIRPLRKYALPLFFARVLAQGSLTRYNAPPLVSVFDYTCATLQIVSQIE